MWFVRRAYGTDALETKVAQTLVVEHAPGDAFISDMHVAAFRDNNDANAGHACNVGDFDLCFGTAVLRKTRKIFQSQNIEHDLVTMLEPGTSNSLAKYP